MIPKIIHLCWFSEESFPVEIKICLASWKRILPDYTIRLWTYADALAIGCDYVSEALSVKNGLLQQMLSVFMQSIKKAEFTWTVICFLKNVLMNLSRSMVCNFQRMLGNSPFTSCFFDR